MLNIHEFNHSRRLKTGGWAEQDVDARAIHKGIDWYRVEDGFGTRGDREDWIADLPKLSVCVSRDLGSEYYRVGVRNFPTIEEAMDEAIKNAMRHSDWKIDKCIEEMQDLQVARARILAAIRA